MRDSVDAYFVAFGSCRLQRERGTQLFGRMEQRRESSLARVRRQGLQGNQRQSRTLLERRQRDCRADHGTKRYNGLHLTVCRREKTESIDEIVAGKEYTITFDSKGGSAVQPVKASAGAAITAPTDPTKDGFVFAGWYESTDGGETLSDTAFSFSYMPARVFTLYAKWATADIKGKTFNKVDATLEWESEAVKQALLAEMEMTEEQFMQTHKESKVTFVFAADKDSVTATYDQNPGEEDDKGKGIATLLYRIKGSAIVFYESQEDMENEIPAHGIGLFVGSTFELSADKTAIIQSNILPGMGTIKYKYSVAVK